MGHRAPRQPPHRFINGTSPRTRDERSKDAYEDQEPASCARASRRRWRWPCSPRPRPRSARPSPRRRCSRRWATTTTTSSPPAGTSRARSSGRRAARSCSGGPIRRCPWRARPASSWARAARPRRPSICADELRPTLRFGAWAYQGEGSLKVEAIEDDGTVVLLGRLSGSAFASGAATGNVSFGTVLGVKPGRLEARPPAPDRRVRDLGRGRGLHRPVHALGIDSIPTGTRPAAAPGAVPAD